MCDVGDRGCRRTRGSSRPEATAAAKRLMLVAAYARSVPHSVLESARRTTGSVPHSTPCAKAVQDTTCDLNSGHITQPTVGCLDIA
eukprot:262564-Rhodomonas_salina.4